MGISAKNWGDVVVWSPWDAMPACYRSFVCVENARAVAPVALKPSESWVAHTEMTVVDL